MILLEVIVFEIFNFFNGENTAICFNFTFIHCIIFWTSRDGENNKPNDRNGVIVGSVNF